MKNQRFNKLQAYVICLGCERNRKARRADILDYLEVVKPAYDTFTERSDFALYYPSVALHTLTLLRGT